MRFHVRTRVHHEGGRGGGVEWRARVSSSSYFQRAIIKGKAERERCARVKGKGINYCRVPGEICKLNSARARARAREREGREGVFLFFTPSPLLSTRRVSTTPRFWLRARLIPPYFSAPFQIFGRKRKSCGMQLVVVNSSGVLFFFFFSLSRGWGINS